jgi:hypothetical protein
MRRLSIALLAAISASALAFVAWVVLEARNIDPTFDRLDYSDPENW